MRRFPLDINSGSISVWVNLQGPLGFKVLRMAVDTGATFTIVPVETALAIGCDPTMSKRRIEFITPSGIEYAPVITIPVVKAFGFTAKNVEIFCHNLPPQSPVEGLLGLNFLKHFNIYLKFKEKILEISQ